LDKLTGVSLNKAAAVKSTVITMWYSIKIADRKIAYSANRVPYREKSWTMFLDDIRVVGFVNGMDIDSDSDFIALIDKNMKNVFINVTWEIDGWEAVKKELEGFFKIELHADIHDTSIVLYPKELAGEKLYDESMKSSIKNILLLRSVADGELSVRVIAQIEQTLKHKSQP
jgi:hypothetical protein